MKEIFRLCFVLTVIAAVSAGVLAFVSEQTAEPIARSLLEEKMSAVRSVLPPFDNDPASDKIKLVVEEGDTLEIYRGIKDGKITGVAFTVVSTEGYSGNIEFMIGIDSSGVISGLEILLHLETPGLGAKIETEDFRSQYEGKSLGDPELWEVSEDGGTFVSITGATISSRAVTRAAAGGLEFFGENRDRLLSGGDDESVE
jgi:electron transport complex protein RnfG